MINKDTQDLLEELITVATSTSENNEVCHRAAMELASYSAEAYALKLYLFLLLVLHGKNVTLDPEYIARFEGKIEPKVSVMRKPNGGIDIAAITEEVQEGNREPT